LKRSIKSLIGNTIGATDGEIGEVKEFYFDEETWTIRYLVVETGNWLFGHKVLIPKEVLLTNRWEPKVFAVKLTREQIKSSLDIHTAKHLLHHQKINLDDHYSLKCEGSGRYYGFDIQESMHKVLSFEEENKASEKPNPNAHLRNTDKVIGYSIMAVDGKIGDVEDFIIDDSKWNLDFMVIDTGNWCPGKKVIISQKWIKEINWDTSTIIINASIKYVKNSPEYDPGQPMSDVYETALHDYYRRYAM